MAAAILLVPGRPIDVSRPMPPLTLPAWLAGAPGRPDPLNDGERLYFTRYGGSAARAAYGDRMLLVVRSSAPLRHLHAPDECLSGAGHTVEEVGVAWGRLPSAIYRSIAPDGRALRVNVTYASSRGELAASLAEVSWRWLQSPDVTWTAYERIAPWDAPATGNDAFDDAVIRAFELPVGDAPARTPSERTPVSLIGDDSTFADGGM